MVLDGYSSSVDPSNNLPNIDLFSRTPKVEPSGLEVSAPLDVHQWSEHQVVKSLVDCLARELGFEKPKDRKFLGVFTVDLFINWERGTYLTVPMSPNSYKGNSRYNALHITRKLISIVKALNEHGMLILHNGFYDRTSGKAYATRVWPSPALVERFAGIERRMISVSDRAEVIILKDTEKKLIEYQDTQKTEGWRNFLQVE